MFRQSLMLAGIAAGAGALSAEAQTLGGAGAEARLTAASAFAETGASAFDILGLDLGGALSDHEARLAELVAASAAAATFDATVQGVGLTPDPFDRQTFTFYRLSFEDQPLNEIRLIYCDLPEDGSDQRFLTGAILRSDPPATFADELGALGERAGTGGADAIEAAYRVTGDAQMLTLTRTSWARDAADLIADLDGRALGQLDFVQLWLRGGEVQETYYDGRIDCAHAFGDYEMQIESRTTLR